MKKKQKKHRLRQVVCQEWLESERGWGVRSDGCSLHLTESDRAEYCKEYWERENARSGGVVPDEYTREDGHPRMIDVPSKLYNKIKKSKNGIRLWQHEYRELTLVGNT